MSTSSVSTFLWAGPARVRRGCGARPTAMAPRRFRKVWVAWQARPGTDSWQAQHFDKVRSRFHGRRSTLTRSGTEFVAGAAL